MHSELTVSDYLRSAAIRRPTRLAYAYAQQEHTWKQVDERVDRLARSLKDMGIGPGDVVASCCKDGPVLVETIFAAARIGAIRVGINYRYSAAEVSQLLEHCGARVVLVQDEFRSIVPAREGVRLVSCGDGQLALGELGQLTEQASRDPVVLDVAENEIAQICYTTGSTGAPKGAVWTHRALSHAMAHTLLDLGISETDIWMHCLPGAGVPGVLAVWNAVIGCTNVILDAFDPRKALEAIQKYHVSRTVWVPTMLSAVCAVAEQQHFDVSSLRRISYGSAPTPPPLIRRALKVFDGVTFDQWYGSTEGAGGWYTQLTPADHLRALDGEEHLLESCGKQMHHATLRVVDKLGEPVAVGEIGEICVRGTFVMQGYYRSPELTAETLRGGWLHTGDMGRMDAEGYLYLVDRKQFMIITGGYNVYPVEVENILAAHPDVAEVCVFGVPDDKWGEAVHALVVPRAGSTVAGEDIRMWCQGRIANFKIPKAIELRESLLRGPTGKILKRAIRDGYLAQAGSKAA